jgi:hypothetical protein
VEVEVNAHLNFPIRGRGTIGVFPLGHFFLEQKQLYLENMKVNPTSMSPSMNGAAQRALYLVQQSCGRRTGDP